LVAISLSDLSNAEGQLPIRRIKNVFEVNENALRGLGAQVCNVFVTLDGAHSRLEHQIEGTRLGEIMHSTFLTLFFWIDMIRAKSLFALAAVDERIRKRSFMTGVSQHD